MAPEIKKSTTYEDVRAVFTSKDGKKVSYDLTHVGDLDVKALTEQGVDIIPVSNKSIKDQQED